MSRPLAGLRVLVTRPEDKARRLLSLLAAEGAEAVHFPTIAIADPPSWEQIDAAARRLSAGDYEWAVFTSVNAVERFVGRTGSAPLRAAKVAAVGEVTRAALEHAGVDVALSPEEFTGVALADALGTGAGNLLLPRVEGAPRATVLELEHRGWAVDEVVAYRNVPPDPASVLPDRFDVILFASGSAARNFVSLVDLEEVGLGRDARKVVVCIGPSTAEAATEAGLPVHVVADVHTDEGMVTALVDHVSKSPLPRHRAR